MEWISVKDRLPELDELVLAYLRRSNPSYQFKELNVGYFIEMAIFDRIEKRGNVFKVDGKEYGDSKEFSQHAIITHWMPLPEPPK